MHKDKDINRANKRVFMLLVTNYSTVQGRSMLVNRHGSVRIMKKHGCVNHNHIYMNSISYNFRSFTGCSVLARKHLFLAAGTSEKHSKG